MSTFLKKSGTFSPLASISVIQSFAPYLPKKTQTELHRKTLQAPIDDFSFVKPIKQSFVKNPRLMPMTRIMLSLIAGWAGQGTSIKTTIGSIAKHLKRSRRQVFRYLKDALEEGYLSYNKTKGRDGLYTGIQIWLNFGAIRFTRFQKKKAESPCKPEVTYPAYINTKQIDNNRKTGEDQDIMKRLLQFGATLGYFEKENCSLSTEE